MAKFSLKLGIFEDIQIRINPGELPLGAHLDASTKAEILKYPLPPNCPGETDYLEILSTIINFLQPFKHLPVIFTEESVLPEVRKIVELIFYESQEDNMLNHLKIYPIEELFLVLRRTVCENHNLLNDSKRKPFSSIAYAKDEFKTSDTSFCYTTASCDYHEEEDALQHCCLSKVRRYGYIIAKWCCNETRYEMQELAHFPLNHERVKDK